MNHYQFDVFGLGQCCLDYLTTVDEYPRADSKCEFSEMTIQGGGPVATALVALSRWGIPCVFAGVIGDGRFGPAIRRSLNDEGVDTRGLLVREGFDSQFAFIAAESGAGRRTVFWRRPTGPPPRPTEIDHDMIKRVRVFHTDGLFIEASLAAARTAKDAGVAVVVDAGSLREGMLELAKLSDYFIASEKFAGQLVGTGSPREACRKLAELGPRVVGVTLGDRGYEAQAQERAIKRPAYSADAVDTTGCGDVFHAGVTYGVLKRWDIDTTLEFAAWAAARVSEKLGGRDGIPAQTEWEVERRDKNPQEK